MWGNTPRASKSFKHSKKYKMKIKNRNGVLGLETSKAVMISFLILAVTGVAVILALSTLQNAVGDTIDNTDYALSATNETGAYINITGYTLDGYNSTWSDITLTALWNTTTDVNILIGNGTISSVGVLTNASTSDYSTNNYGVDVSYTYTYTYDSGQMDSITGNVSEGIVTFFASTGTIFSILIVIVIILSISIIIWAVGRFGQRAEGTEQVQGMDL